MSKQTDQLLLWDDEQHQQETNDSAPTADDFGRAKERLRVLEDLKEHRGYKMLIEALKYEGQLCLMAMDRADNPTAITKASANYYSLTCACAWVDKEAAQLRALLAANGR